jgi:uncharacterized membrane protein YphA (DoxX/SURF4 family)
MLLGIFLIVGLLLRISAVSLSVLLMIFIAAIFIKYLNGTLENCGCFTTSLGSKEPKIEILLLRDIGLIFLGVLIMISKYRPDRTKELISQNDK